MPKTCCVPGCNSNYISALKQGKAKKSSFLFPKDEILLNDWVRAIPRKDWMPTQYSVVCSDHFMPSEILREDVLEDSKGNIYKHKFRLPKLADGAVPRIFPNVPAYATSGSSTLERLLVESGESARERKATAAGEGLTEGEPHGHVTCDKESASGEFRMRTHSSCSFPETNKYTLDQEVLMDLHELSDKMQNFYPAVQGNSFTVTFKGSDGDKCEYVFSSASESRRHGVPHGGVRCSECLADITGFRYKCVSCPDYNLCGACEALGVHEQHMMMRISRPLKSKHASLLVQRWCKAMKSTGVATLDDLCDPAPAPSAGDAPHGDRAQADQAIIYQVLNLQPITVKHEPMDKDDTETPSTSKIATKPKCRVEPVKRRANISIVVSNEDEGVPMKKAAISNIKEEKEAESSEEQTLADYYEGFAESESEVDIDEVKLEVEDSLSSGAYYGCGQ